MQWYLSISHCFSWQGLSQTFSDPESFAGTSVAVCNTVLQYVAIRNVICNRSTERRSERVAVCHNALQSFVVCCSLLHRVALHIRTNTHIHSTHTQMGTRVHFTHMQFKNISHAFTLATTWFKRMRLLQCVAVRYSTFQCAELCFSVLHCVAVLHRSTIYAILHTQCIGVYCSELQCISVYCSVLPCVAMLYISFVSFCTHVRIGLVVLHMNEVVATCVCHCVTVRSSVLQYVAVCHRPTESIMHIPFQVNRFQNSILLIVQYKYLKSCSEDFLLKNPTKIRSSAQDHAILHLLLNTVGFFISNRQKSACWKWFVPQLYQLRRDILEGPALKYFYMIHRVGRTINREC